MFVLSNASTHWKLVPPSATHCRRYLFGNAFSISTKTRVDQPDLAFARYTDERLRRTRYAMTQENEM
jgi:hypothetical protein